MTTEKLVEENLGLVHYILHNFVRLPQHTGAYSYEDLYQVGCIGLWKAAQNYVPGKARFSTYACVLIRNEVFSELRKQNRIKEVLLDHYEIGMQMSHQEMMKQNLASVMQEAKSGADGIVLKGITALELMNDGMKCRDIASRLGVPVNYVTSWIARAKKYLRKSEKLVELLGEYCETDCA